MFFEAGLSYLEFVTFNVRSVVQRYLDGTIPWGDEARVQNHPTQPRNKFFLRLSITKVFTIRPNKSTLHSPVSTSSFCTYQHKHTLFWFFHYLHLHYPTLASSTYTYTTLHYYTQNLLFVIFPFCAQQHNHTLFGFFFQVWLKYLRNKRLSTSGGWER